MRRALGILAVAVIVLAASGGTTATAAPATKAPYTTQPYSMGEDAQGDPSDWWTCTGYRLVAGTSVQDHFTCTVTDQTFSGTFTQAIAWPCGCTGWLSDVDGSVAKTYAIHVGADGRVNGVATY